MGTLARPASGAGRARAMRATICVLPATKDNRLRAVTTGYEPASFLGRVVCMRATICVLPVWFGGWGLDTRARPAPSLACRAPNEEGVGFGGHAQRPPSLRRSTVSIAGRYEGTACAYLSLATRARNLLSLASISRSPLSLAPSLPACPLLRDGTPPWRQHRGKWVIYLVSSHTNANSKRCHLWENDLRFALNSTPSLWGADAGGYPRVCEREIESESVC